MRCTIIGAVVVGVLGGRVLGGDMMLAMGAMAIRGLGKGINLEIGTLRRATTGNLQTFTGALGGKVADPITTTTDKDRPFTVQGDTFNDLVSAQQRSCANQHNACAGVANSADKASGITVGDCDKQQTTCTDTTLSETTDTSSSSTESESSTTSTTSSSTSSTTTSTEETTSEATTSTTTEAQSTTQTTTAEPTFFSSDANFDYFCDV